MNELIDQLRQARVDADAAKNALAMVKAEIEQEFGERLAAAEARVAVAKLNEEAAYQVLKDTAIATYRTNGGTKTRGPVTVTVSTKLVYDDESALPYCIANETLHQYLSVSRKGLDKVLGAMGEKPEWVDEKVEYGVRIKSQL